MLGEDNEKRPIYRNTDRIDPERGGCRRPTLVPSLPVSPLLSRPIRTLPTVAGGPLTTPAPITGYVYACLCTSLTAGRHSKMWVNLWDIDINRPYLTNFINQLSKVDGGEGGIRTRGTGLPYTCFPSKRLKPLGHLSTYQIF